MMLQALLALAEREHLGDPDFAPVGVRWLLPVTAAGEFAGPPIPVAADPDAKKPRPKEMFRPFTSQNELNQGDRSNFLCDTLERAALFLDAKSNPARTRQHEYFKSLLAEAAAAGADAEALNAVLAALGRPDQLSALHSHLVEAEAKPSDVGTFTVAGANLLDSPALQAYWRARRSTARRDRELPVRICLATGRPAPALNTHEKIKGIPGANPTGANLVSFDKDSFCSFDLPQAQNAPVSADAEPKIRGALDDLISKSRSQRLVLGDSILLHWTRRPVSLDPFDLLGSPDPDAVRALLQSVREGRERIGMDANAYYAATLSGNGSRAVVRDWLESTVPTVAQTVAGWFRDLEVAIFDPPWSRREFSLCQLLSSIANQKLDKPFNALPHAAAASLARAALAGSPPPRNLLAAAIRREAVDRQSGSGAPQNPARFALIKLCLLRSPDRKEHHTVTVHLDPESKDTAYLSGQLFAVLGRLQLIALGKVGAGIAERAYGGVSARPATTLGPVFTKTPAYLKKANDRYPGAGTNKQKEIETLCARIEAQGGLPRTLNLEDQARFALGYYCQLAAYRARREEADIENQANQIEERD